MIEFDDVSFVYPNGITALKSVNLRVTQGEVVALVGENGAGKTTLVRQMNGLLKPTKGSVKVFGMDTRRASIAQLSRRVGIVFQNPDHQLFSESVEKEIAFGLTNFGFPEDDLRKRVDWALDFLELREYQDVSPMLLSGGEKKRLCLAAVLSWDPNVLVLDEPTVGQDYRQKEKLVQIIRRMNEQEKTVVIVSHDVEFIWPLEPRVIVMSRAEVIADGPAEGVLCDDSILKRANLLKPQLAELSDMLGHHPREAFTDPHKAGKWILERIGDS